MTPGYFGIDSSQAAQSLASSVHAFVGSLPSWWGRYLANYVLTDSEAAWLHANGVRILPIWNGALAGDVTGSYANGQQQARWAVAAAKALAVPAGVFIPIDVESGWFPTSDFFTGYIDGIHAGGYTGGAYLNVLETSHVTPWIAARAASSAPAYIYSSEPEPFALKDVVHSDWYDFTKTALGLARAADVTCWQYCEGSLGDAIDLDVCTSMCYEDLLWAPAAAAGRAMVVAACGLKKQPAHGGPNVAEIPKGGQCLDTGTRSGEWARIQWRDVSGWVLASNLVPIGGSA